MSGSRAMIEALTKENVRCVLGVMDEESSPSLWDALSDSDIRRISVNHEQVAAHAADAFGRVSGEPGVCVTTSGAGATNLVTGIATAFADSAPVVAITALTGWNGIDAVGIFNPITKYTIQPMSTAEIPSAVKKAFFIAASGRPGPVLVDVPEDVQQGSADVTFPVSISVRGYERDAQPNPVEIERAVEMIAAAERPMLFGGGGLRISNASEPFQAVAELIGAPVVTSLQGKGIFPEDHPLSLGPIGMYGRAEANKLVSECDLLLAVGVRFSDRSTGTFSEFCREAKVVHVDVDPSEFNKNKPVDIHICGDARLALTLLFQSLAERLSAMGDGDNNDRRDSWLSRVNHVREEMKGIPAYRDSCADLSGPKVLRKMREILPPGAILTTGVGRHQMWAEIHFRVLRPRSWITSTGLGTMGFGLPAAIGAKLARPDLPVVDFDGDGSFVMTESALGTAVEERIPIVAIVLNDRSLGMVEQWQRLMYDRRYIGIRTRVPDFVKLAEAYGVYAVTVDSLQEFAKALREGVSSDSPFVIEVPVSPEEDVFPFMPPGKSLRETVYDSTTFGQ